MTGTKTRRTVNRIILALAVCLLIVLMAGTVSAIGILPAEKAIKYQPGKRIVFNIDIVNNGHEELEVLMYARGKFADYLEITEPVFSLSPTDDRKSVKVQFMMPGNLNIAGDQEIEIVAVGTTPTPEGQDAVVKADIAVISKLVVEIPYPDKYAEADVHILDTEAGKPLTISLPIFNKGQNDIEQAYFKVDIYTAEKEKVEELFSEKASLKAGESRKLTVTTKKELAAGAYMALVSFFYDNKMDGIEKRFNVGELEIDIKSLVVDSFTLGGLAKFDILLQNKWSTELKNVYAEMEISDADNKVYTDFKTVATDILPQKLGRLEGYWNTQGVAPGTYTARVTLHYGNKVSDRFFELDVLQDRIIVRDMLTGKAIDEGDGDNVDLANTGFLVVIIGIMAVVIGVLVYKLKKRNIDKQAQAPITEKIDRPSTASTEVTQESKGEDTSENKENG